MGKGRKFLKALFKRYRRNRGSRNRFKAFRNRFMKRSAAPGRGRKLFKKYRMRHGALVQEVERYNRFQAFRNRFKKRAAAHGTGRAFLKALFKRYRNKAFMRKLSGGSNRFKAFRNRFMKRAEPPGKGRKFLKALFKRYRRNRGSRNRFKAFRNRFKAFR